jgi:DNA-binding response OmpR family regulator
VQKACKSPTSSFYVGFTLRPTIGVYNHLLMGERDKPRILVVEDETNIREGVCDVLAYHGYDPDAVGSGDLGLARALSGDYSLLILDVMLPGLSGLDVCERVRAERRELPILMLTAKGSEDDVVEGFRVGADDYVCKPFSVRELSARVRALLKRSGALDEPARFRIGDWSVDAACGRATGQTGEQIELSPREVAILSLLSQERGRIVPRRRLLQQVWKLNNPDQIETRTVDMHVAKLRKKIDRGGHSPI